MNLLEGARWLPAKCWHGRFACRPSGNGNVGDHQRRQDEAFGARRIRRRVALGGQGFLVSYMLFPLIVECMQREEEARIEAGGAPDASSEASSSD